MDPRQKDLEIATVISYEWAWGRVLDEINKCVCLCRNCHSKLHAGRFQVTNDMLCREGRAAPNGELTIAAGAV
jgi:hypothetical protein